MDYKDSIGYLIHQLAHSIDAESDQVLLERFGIGFAQYKVLVCLEEVPGIPQKQIALNLSQTEASISRQIKLLSQKKLIELGPAKDGRRKLVYLSLRGEELVRRATGGLNVYHSPIFAKLSEKQQLQLRELLGILKQVY